MIQDVLLAGESTHNPHLLQPETAGDKDFGCVLLRVCSRETFIVLLSRNNVMAGVVESLRRTLHQPLRRGADLGNLILNPEVYRSAIQLMGRLARKDELQREYSLIDELLEATTVFL